MNDNLLEYEQRVIRERKNDFVYYIEVIMNPENTIVC